MGYEWRWDSPTERVIPATTRPWHDKQPSSTSESEEDLNRSYRNAFIHSGWGRMDPDTSKVFVTVLAIIAIVSSMIKLILLIGGPEVFSALDENYNSSAVATPSPAPGATMPVYKAPDVREVRPHAADNTLYDWGRVLLESWSYRPI